MKPGFEKTDQSKPEEGGEVLPVQTDFLNVLKEKPDSVPELDNLPLKSHFNDEAVIPDEDENYPYEDLRGTGHRHKNRME